AVPAETGPTERDVATSLVQYGLTAVGVPYPRADPTTGEITSWALNTNGATITWSVLQSSSADSVASSFTYAGPPIESPLHATETGELAVSETYSNAPTPSFFDGLSAYLKSLGARMGEEEVNRGGLPGPSPVTFIIGGMTHGVGSAIHLFSHSVD